MTHSEACRYWLIGEFPITCSVICKLEAKKLDLSRFIFMAVAKESSPINANMLLHVFMLMFCVL